MNRTLTQTADALELSLREVLGLTEQDTRSVDAMTREFVRLRSLNPKVFQAALILLMSTELAIGDTVMGTSGSDIKAKLERMTALQLEVSKLVAQAKDEALSRILDDYGIDTAPVAKEKVN